MEKKTVVRVIGIGNSMAGDDALGTLIIGKLRRYRMQGIELIDAGAVGLSLLNLLEGAEKVIIIDAFRGGGQTGEIVRLVIPEDLGKISVYSWDSAMSSTHLIGVGEALTMGQVLGILPACLVIYGIELSQTEIGAGLSGHILPSVEQVTARILHDLEQWTCMNCT